MNVERTNNRYICFDILKAICAFMVVCIHKSFIFAEEEIRVICRIAVPIFFMISGFFYEELKRKNKIKEQILKIFKLFVFFSIFYALYLIIRNACNGIEIKDYLSSVFTTGNLFCLLLFNYHPLTVLAWYLSALLYTIIIVNFVSSKLNKKILYFISPLLLIIGVIFGAYSDKLLNLSIPLAYTRNFLFEGIPFYSIGMYFYSIKNKLNNININICLIFILCFAGLSIFEYYLLTKSNNVTGDIFFSTVILAISVFILFYKLYENKNINKLDITLSEIGKSYSMGIYFIQIMVRDILDIVMNKLNIINYYSYIAPIMIYLCCIMLIYLYKKVIKRSVL